MDESFSFLSLSLSLSLAVPPTDRAILSLSSGLSCPQLSERGLGCVLCILGFIIEPSGLVRLADVRICTVYLQRFYQGNSISVLYGIGPDASYCSTELVIIQRGRLGPLVKNILESTHAEYFIRLPK